jgi:hypothetical protein
MFWLWWRLHDADRLSIWRRYGWFCALMFCGSCAGVLSYAAWSQWLIFYHDADYDAEGTQRGSAQFSDAVRSYATVSYTAPYLAFPLRTSCVTHAIDVVCRRCVGSLCMP